VNGVAAWLLFGAPFCVVFYGAGCPNCYVPREHVLSIIQVTVPTMPNLSSLLCLLTSDGDSNPRDIGVRARGGGLWRISDAHYAYDPCEVTFRPSTPGSTRWLCRSTFATNEGKNASIILNARLRL
jgi:hypothetical protein